VCFNGVLLAFGIGLLPPGHDGQPDLSCRGEASLVAVHPGRFGLPGDLASRAVLRPVDVPR
jgi:hypothetical protein